MFGGFAARYAVTKPYMYGSGQIPRLHISGSDQFYRHMTADKLACQLSRKQFVNTVILLLFLVKQAQRAS
jgi:hypothetical protein